MKLKIDRYLGWFLAALMAIITLDVLWGVFTRYALGSQAGWSEELARFLLIWIGILGGAWASGQKMHLAIDLLQPSLSLGQQYLLGRFIAVLVALFALTVLVVGGSRLVYITHELAQVSAALQWPMAIVYLVLPISGLLIIYYQVHFFRQAEPILFRSKTTV
ncbi:MAG: TRAP transporter small permease [Lewinella sp.]|nr:TRAP transporter small permease [Lewinella sp.]